jgi:hypothetical protein
VSHRGAVLNRAPGSPPEIAPANARRQRQRGVLAGRGPENLDAQTSTMDVYGLILSPGPATTRFRGAAAACDDIVGADAETADPATDLFAQGTGNTLKTPVDYRPL